MMNLINFETSVSSITTMESSIFTPSLLHFYSRTLLKRISADKMVTYRNDEKNTTVYVLKKKPDV